MAKRKEKPLSAKFQDFRDQLCEHNEEAILFDGYEDALIGVCYQFGRSPVAVYDYQGCIDILMKRDGMNREEANEFFEFNSLGCYAGEDNPVFVTLFTKNSSTRTSR